MNALRVPKSTVVLALLVAAAVTVPAMGPPAAATDPPEATAARYCGKVKLSFTSAKVRARHVTCANARRFMSAFLNRPCSKSNPCPPPRVKRFRGYRCVTSGSDVLVRHSCRKGRKAIGATHGG